MPEKTALHYSLPLEVSIQIHEKNGLPAVELRRNTTDPKVITALLTCAFRKIPIIIQPKFTDTKQSLATMIDKGIVYLNAADHQYYFNI